MDRYEEALERAKAGKPMDEVFPELKESEDERTRKNLVEFLDDVWHLGRDANFDKWGKADCADWLAYLEKQKEQKQKALRITGSFVDGSYKYDLVDMPKPAECSEEGEIVRCLKALVADFVRDKKGSVDATFYQRCTDWIERRHAEQKPELCDMGRWDEESYNNGIYHVLHNPEAYGLTKQKPAEWSDEDVMIIDGIIMNLDYLLHDTVLVPHTKENIEERIKWLRRIRNFHYKAIWKPTEKQLEALRIQCKALDKAWKDPDRRVSLKIDVLKTLLNDLEKLM